MKILFKILFLNCILQSLPHEIKRRKLLLPFLVIFYLTGLTINSIAQPSITWQRIFDGPGHHEDDGSDICQSSDGYFYALGSTQTIDHAHFHPYLLKLNAKGDTMWTLVISAVYGNAYAIAPSSDSGCIVAGFSGNVTTVKVSSSGNIVWIRQYGTDLLQIQSIIRK